MNYAVLICWILIVWSITARPGTLLVLLLASLPFDSLALLPTEAVGGMSILPQSMFAVVLILKVVAPEVMTLSPKFLTALQLRHLGILVLFFLVGIVTTLIMPRLFQGEIVVLPMRLNWIPSMLSPIQANFTQSGYVTLSVMTAFAVTLMADEVGFTKTLLTGLLAAGIVCVVTGLIDMAAASTGTERFLEPFRNAEYALLTNAGLGGLRRVVGFTPEASAYGPLCVQFAATLGLLRSVYAEGLPRTLATLVAVGLVLMALLSTSSTAYGGLAILGLVYAANLVRRAVWSSRLGQSGLLWELLAGLGAMVALLFVLVARAHLFDPLLDVIDEAILNKPLSGSFYERSHWNAVAWDAFASTWGLGIGFGSTRTSNWFAAIVSNTGVIGAVLMGIFLIQSFARRLSWRTPLHEELLPALKLSLLPALAMEGVDTSGPDFGLWMAVVFGAIAGIAASRPAHSSIGHVAADEPMPLRVRGRRAIGSRAFGRVIRPASHQDSGRERPAPRTSF